MGGCSSKAASEPEIKDYDHAVSQSVDIDALASSPSVYFSLLYVNCISCIANLILRSETSCSKCTKEYATTMDDTLCIYLGGFPARQASFSSHAACIGGLHKQGSRLSGWR